MRKIISIMLVGIFIQGCVSAEEHRKAVQDNSKNRITVGTVQREIKKGMSSAKVVEILGSPNIVSTDKDNNEVWIYDKVSSNLVSSNSLGGVNILLLFGGNSAGAISSSQRTLTIIIKFNKNNKVKDFSYRTSSF
jgi:outer membrane protein assembly factor BamE (lipoprotein component of BamABCDE complex)